MFVILCRAMYRKTSDNNNLKVFPLDVLMVTIAAVVIVAVATIWWVTS